VPSITFTLPVAGQDADAGPIATNFSDLQTLLNGGLDATNLADDSVGIAELSATGTPSATTFLRGDNVWAPAGSMVLLDDLIVSGSVLATYDTDARLGGALPTTYKNLLLIVSARSNGASAYLRMSINGDSGANYNYALGGATSGGVFAGTGAVAAGDARVGYIAPTGAGANRVANSRIEFINYRDTTFKKGWLVQTYEHAAAALSGGGSWENAGSAITRIVLSPDVGSFAIGSRFSLYGIS
jgi:hypothetical protein